nr:MAK10-like protein [Tanacetum cinerariifolium]
MGYENPICTLGDYFNPSHEGYKNTIDLHIGNNVVPLRSDTIWLVQNGCLFHRLLSEDPNQYLMDFLKLVDSLDLDAHLAPIQSTQMNKITTSCEICNGPYDTLYCMENPKQAFVDYASSPTDEARENDGEVVFIEIIRDNDEPQNRSLNEGEGASKEGPMVVLGRSFTEVSNMTHDLPEGVVRFTNENNEVAYKIPHKIEQYNSFSSLEKEHTKSVYLRNEEDKRRGVDYVMSKIIGFYKECIELGPEYVIGLNDVGEVT